MCIFTPSGSGPSTYGHQHGRSARHYGRQARKGGWLFERVLPRLVGHAFAEVLAGRMTFAEWWAYETDLDRHQPDCRYVRLVRAVSR